MKKIVQFLVFSFLFTVSFAQYTPQSGYGNQFNRIKPVRVLHLPVYTDDTTLQTTDTSAQIRINNGVLQYHWGYWRNITGGSSTDISGKLNISDTAAMLLPYLRSNIAAATYVPITRTITINGTAFDLSANRSWSVGSLSNPLSQFASTTSAQLAGVISNETGTGVAVFNTSPTFLGGITAPVINTTTGLFGASTSSNNIYHWHNVVTGVNFAANNASTFTSNRTTFSFNENWTPASGTGTLKVIGIIPIINQTATASGTVHGFYYNPTLTSVLGAHNAWENVSGNMLFGTTSGSVSVGTATVPASAILSAFSTTKGFLPPRMSTAQRDAISSPVEGLQVFNTTTHEANFWNGTAWVAGGASITGKLNISDTAAMLSPYLRSNIAAATYVPLSRTITINGETFDLSANRSWTVSATTPTWQETLDEGSTLNKDNTINVQDNTLMFQTGDPGYVTQEAEIVLADAIQLLATTGSSARDSLGQIFVSKEQVLLQSKIAADSDSNTSIMLNPTYLELTTPSLRWAGAVTGAGRVLTDVAGNGNLTLVAPSGGTAWGDITGTLADQTDLQTALDLKQDDLTLTTTGTSGEATLVGSTLNIPEYDGGGGAVSSVANSDGTLTISPTTGAVVASLNPAAPITWTGAPIFSGVTTTLSGAQTAAAWGTAGINLRTVAATYTDNNSSGTVTSNTVNSFGIPTLAAGSATTYTGASNVYIAGAPAQGTNVTISNPFSLHVAAGISAFVGGIGTSGGSNVGSNFFAAGGTSATTTGTAGVQIAGSSAVNYRTIFNGTSSTTLSAGNNYSNVIIGAAPITEPGTGNNALLANFTVRPIGTITSGAATVGNTASFYVDDATTATVTGENYAAYIKGKTRFDVGSDAAGDIFYRTTAGSLARLGVGTNGQILKVSSLIPAWETLTATDVGLGNVDNTSDATKNAATVTLTNKTLTSPVINTPTGIVKGDVGLGNVDNTSDANKPVSTATQTALDLKQNNLTITTTGTSGEATLVGSTLNIPEYDGGGTGTTVISLTVANSPYSVLPTSGETVYLVDASGGAVTLNLPTAVGNTAKYVIKKTDASANTVTTDASGTQEIDGGLTAVLAVQYESISIVSNSSNWFIF